MDIHSVRQQLRMKSIYDIPLRVTYYARVSSESDEQLNSLGNQIRYYEDFIRKNASWTCADDVSVCKKLTGHFVAVLKLGYLLQFALVIESAEEVGCKLVVNV